jgi:hypothetical protein
LKTLTHVTIQKGFTLVGYSYISHMQLAFHECNECKCIMIPCTHVKYKMSHATKNHMHLRQIWQILIVSVICNKKSIANDSCKIPIFYPCNHLATFVFSTMWPSILLWIWCSSFSIHHTPSTCGKSSIVLRFSSSPLLIVAYVHHFVVLIFSLKMKPPFDHSSIELHSSIVLPSLVPP